MLYDYVLKSHMLIFYVQHVLLPCACECLCLYVFVYACLCAAAPSIPACEHVCVYLCFILHTLEVAHTSVVRAQDILYLWMLVGVAFCHVEST